MGPRWGPTQRLTDWQTVSRNVTLTWADYCSAVLTVVLLKITTHLLVVSKCIRGLRHGHGSRNQGWQCWRRPVENYYCVQSSYRKSNPTSRQREVPIWKYIIGLGRNRNVVMGPDGTWNQEWLCWRGPAANYCSTPNILIGGLVEHKIFLRYKLSGFCRSEVPSERL
jgi:hypothetical protein